MPNSIKKLEEAFKEGKYDQLLKDIYVDEAVIEYQQERYIKALESFEKIYGEKEVEIYSAPGRSEVGGNHTDHQFGKVLATSINLDAIAIVAKRDDDVIDLKSEGYERIIVSLSSFDPAKAEKGTSQALIQGVASKLKEEGYKIGGFEAYVTSDVLNGAGMSSSAAFEVLIGNILSGLYNDMKIDPVFLAQAGQYAENVYFGKPCGLMDQMASSIGGLINIDFEDPQSPKIKKVEVDFEEYGHSLCIVDTKGSHADLTDDYAAIPYEMKKVANYFNQEALREVDKDDFYLNLPKIREILGDRAVCHHAQAGPARRALAGRNQAHGQHQLALVHGVQLHGLLSLSAVGEHQVALPLGRQLNVLERGRRYGIRNRLQMRTVLHDKQRLRYSR